MIAALVSIPLVLGGLGAVELASIESEKAALQDAVDAGALEGAGELSVVLTSSAETMVQTRAINAATSALSDGLEARSPQFSVSVDQKMGTVSVHGAVTHSSNLTLLGLNDSVIEATGIAENLQKSPLCVLQTEAGTMKLNNTAIIRAKGCTVHSNDNIDVASTAMIEAERIQAVGKVNGITTPKGNSGAIRIDDPFVDMDLKPPSPCFGSNKLKTIAKGTLTLSPGVHCDEYKISGTATLQLLPGEHYFEGEIDLKGNTSVSGQDVVLIFGGDDSFSFAEKAAVTISARKTGKFAGFLIITSRTNTNTFTIASDKVSQLLGTIYIPNSTLEISTAGNVAQDSAWSVIVAKHIKLTQDPILVINKDYVGSGVPVPDGVGPIRRAPRLTK